MPDGKVCPEQFRGWLMKWTNYIKGYQRRWFVLSNGLLSYYRTQEEMAHTCRGTINLAGAFIDTIDATRFVITNGPSQVYHLKVLNEVERQRWVTALELAKAKAIRTLESDDSDSQGSENEGSGEEPLTILKEKLKELNASHDLVVKNGHQLLKQITEAEETTLSKSNSSPLKEKLALFKLTSNAMVKAAAEFMVQARSTDHRWSRALQHEQAIRLELQENMETLANQMHGLETQAQEASLHGGILQQQSLNGTSRSSLESHDNTSVVSHDVSRTLSDIAMESTDGNVAVGGRVVEGEAVKSKERVEETEKRKESDEDEDKFFDALERAEDWERTSGDVFDTSTDRKSVLPGHMTHPRKLSSVSINEAQSMVTGPEEEHLPVTRDRTMSVPRGPGPSFFENWRPTLGRRRTTISPRPHHRLNLWSFVKNCIGKDLTKVPVPVNFNEPLSFLQRMVEDLIYSDILAQAARCETTMEELAHLAAFATSCFAAVALSTRMNKSFNPLLGETYECDRRAESGWRCILEQVSHHPPMFAMHVEHREWTLWEEYTMSSKFRGKYLAVYPTGNTHMVFHRTGSHYTWGKVPTTIHNIIVGKLWVDLSGDMKIVNHTTGEEGHMRFHAYSYFSREQQRKVTGKIRDKDGEEQYLLRGYWDETMEFSKIISREGKNTVTTPFQTLWRVTPPLPGSELIYGFSEFPCSLNEMEEGVAPTDSRLRPDQRTMENGDFDEANKEKVRLEEKQRGKRHKREAAAAKAAEAAAAGKHKEAARLEKESTTSPLWFHKEYDPYTNTMMHMYSGGYWEGKSKCDWGKELPDLF